MKKAVRAGVASPEQQRVSSIPTRVNSLREHAESQGIRKAVVYARVASKEQEGFSIPAQLKLLRQYAQSHALTRGNTSAAYRSKHISASPKCDLAAEAQTEAQKN